MAEAIDVKLLIWRLPFFIVPKLLQYDMCNQVKSGTKHGRPDQSYPRVFFFFFEHVFLRGDTTPCEFEIWHAQSIVVWYHSIG